MSAAPKLRIVTDGPMGHQTRVLILRDTDRDNWWDDGAPIEISNYLTGAGLRLDVGDVNKAALDAIVVGGTIDAVLDELVVRHVGHSSFGRIVWRLRKWWWGVRVRDVTAAGSTERRYVR